MSSQGTRDLKTNLELEMVIILPYLHKTRIGLLIPRDVLGEDILGPVCGSLPNASPTRKCASFCSSDTSPKLSSFPIQGVGGSAEASD